MWWIIFFGIIGILGAIAGMKFFDWLFSDYQDYL